MCDRFRRFPRRTANALKAEIPVKERADWETELADWQRQHSGLTLADRRRPADRLLLADHARPAMIDYPYGAV